MNDEYSLPFPTFRRKSHVELTSDIRARLDQLAEKYAAMGQDMISYLDGLLYADYLTYWDYIRLDTLLSLQSTQTPLPDEAIFVTYHQITELYLKLCIQAIERLEHAEDFGPELLMRQLDRLNRYLKQMIDSFDVMVEGMDKEEFLKFRMSLLPSSGFQSAQFRMLEIMSTELPNLVHPTQRANLQPTDSAEAHYAKFYWRSGATELKSGRKTLTLRQFEEKYRAVFLRLADRMREQNLWKCYQRLQPEEQRDPRLRASMRRYDHQVNVGWALSHLRAAGRYLVKKPQVMKATGGTNWQQYLPPRHQQIHFFPELWTEAELAEWGTAKID